MPIRLPSGSNVAPIPVGLASAKALLAAESTTPGTLDQDIEILRLGSFDFGVWTENIIKVDDELLDGFVSNHLAGARGKNADGSPADLPIDIDHETRDAAGWITNLSRIDGRLMASVSWNSLGIELIAGDRFRFMSVMFADQYKDPEGKAWGATLWGAAMTNYPRIKDMASLSLSAREVGHSAPTQDATRTPTPSEARDMDTKLIAATLGLPEDSTEEAITEALKANATQGADTTPDPTTARMAAEIETLTANQNRLEERETARTAEMATLKAATCIEKHERTGRLTPGMLVDADGKPNSLANLAATDLDAFDEIVGNMKPAVAFGAVGSSSPNGGTSDDPSDALNDAIIAKMTADSLGYDAAAMLIAKERPELMAAAYPDEMAVTNRV